MSVFAPKNLRGFKLYQGWNEAKMIMQAKMFSAMGVWTGSGTTTHDPHHQPVPTRRRGAQSSRPCIGFDFWKLDLGAFTERGQCGPCLTDAAQ